MSFIVRILMRILLPIHNHNQHLTALIEIYQLQSQVPKPKCLLSVLQLTSAVVNIRVATLRKPTLNTDPCFSPYQSVNSLPGCLSHLQLVQDSWEDGAILSPVDLQRARAHNLDTILVERDCQIVWNLTPHWDDTATARLEKTPITSTVRATSWWMKTASHVAIVSCLPSVGSIKLCPQRDKHASFLLSRHLHAKIYLRVPYNNTWLPCQTSTQLHRDVWYGHVWQKKEIKTINVFTMHSTVIKCCLNYSCNSLNGQRSLLSPLLLLSSAGLHLQMNYPTKLIHQVTPILDTLKFPYA